MQEKYVDKKILKKLYIKEKKSYREIARELGFHPSLIFRKLKKYNIPLRTGIVWNKGKTKVEYPQLKGNTISHTAWNKGLKLSLAYRKKLSECHADISGNKNPFFGQKHTKETKKIMSLKKGGTGVPGENSEYGIDWNSKLREKIRKRDDYRCQLTGMTEEENLMIHGRVLDVHHIDYNKLNNEENNLISLSYESHKRTNYNREYWVQYFQKIMEKK